MAALDALPQREAEQWQLQLQSLQRLAEALAGADASPQQRRASETFHQLMLERAVPQRLADHLVRAWRLPRLPRLPPAACCLRACVPPPDAATAENRLLLRACLARCACGVPATTSLRHCQHWLTALDQARFPLATQDASTVQAAHPL
jgi:DNA-binding GntR family transcriptional regulator